MCPGCVSDPKGFGRLLDTQGKVVASYLPNEGFLTSENFTIIRNFGFFSVPDVVHKSIDMIEGILGWAA